MKISSDFILSKKKSDLTYHKVHSKTVFLSHNSKGKKDYNSSLKVKVHS